MTEPTFSDGTSNFMVRPGVGAIHSLNTAEVSAEIDYRMIFTSGDSTKGVRLFVALRKKL